MGKDTSDESERGSSQQANAAGDAAQRMLAEAQASAKNSQDNQSNYVDKTVNTLDSLLHSPMTTALSARASYLGLTNQMGTAGMPQVEKLLSKLDTPVAGQLLERMSQMKSNGWVMRPGLHYPNPLIAGGNMPFLRIMEYSPIPTLFSHRNAVQDAAIIVSHEVTHTDGLLHSKTLLSEGLPRYKPELKLVAERDLIKELRASLTEMHIADSMGIRDQFPARARQDIGKFVQEHWLGDCPALGALTPEEASSIAKNYMDKTFGPNLIDPVTKKVRAFDLNAGVGQNVGTLSADKQALEYMSDAHYLENRALANPRSASTETFMEFAETGSGRALMRAGKTFGAIATLAIAADLNHAFKQGTDVGLARTARVGMGWMAFEGASALAMRGAQNMGLFGRACVGLTAGFVGAYITDTCAGDPLEKNLIGLMSTKK